MKRTLRQLPLIAALLTALFLTGGCDDANPPDMPVQPYSLAATVATGPSVIVDLDASGDYLAVAYEYYGFKVLNVADLNAISAVDSYHVIASGARIQSVVLDGRNKLVGATMLHDDGDSQFIRDFNLHRRVSDLGGSGAREAFFLGSPDTVTIWLTNPDSDNRLQGERRLRATDTTWRRDVEYLPTEWTAPAGTGIQHFGICETGMIAVAFQAGIKLYDGNTGTPGRSLYLPGHSYDCAWHGNDVVVAADFAMLIVNTDSVNAPRLVTEYVIPGRADRLRQVEVDGDYAVLLDEADGIYVVDISNVLAPRLVQEIPFVEPSALDIENHILYVGDAVQGLQVFTRN